MTIRRFTTLIVLIGAGALAAFGLRSQAAPLHWHVDPAITVIGRADDPRLPAVREAVAFWNSTFAALPTTFRLGDITRIDGTVPEEELRDLSNGTLQGVWNHQGPKAFESFRGDLLIVLSDADFVSFTSRIGDRMLVAIKDGTQPPLTLPNVLPNVIAHEIGHALGLQHNTDPTTLMCGRPATCRPASFVSDVPRMFPLTPEDIARLRELYPASRRGQ
jgi:predicted Zn-dependent protease